MPGVYHNTARWSLLHFSFTNILEKSVRNPSEYIEHILRKLIERNSVNFFWLKDT